MFWCAAKQSKTNADREKGVKWTLRKRRSKLYKRDQKYRLFRLIETFSDNKLKLETVQALERMNLTVKYGKL